MNMNELYNQVFINQRTGMTASFPMAFKDGRGERGLTWFYYFSKQEKDTDRMTVSRVAVSDEDLNYRLDDVDWQFDLDQAAEVLAGLSVAEFYALLSELLEAADLDEEAIWELLSKTVSEEMVKVYQKVVDYAVEQLKDVTKTDVLVDKDMNQDQEKNRKVVYDQLVQGAKYTR